MRVTGRAGVPGLTAVLCADWSKDPGGREVYGGFVASRAVRRLPPPASGWTVASVLAAAAARADGGATLVGFDAPIGIPRSFWDVMKREPDWEDAPTFADWLPRVRCVPSFFDPVAATEWCVRRPFFRVPAGQGSRGAFEVSLRVQGISPLRKVDQAARANPLFIVSGIPGSVGSAACDLWRGLAEIGRAQGQPRIWPFDGSLEELAQPGAVVIGEIYPRLAYGAALDDAPPGDRGRLTISKTAADTRREVLRLLLRGEWVKSFGVEIGDVATAEGSEDAFDALVSASAILRSLLEGCALSDPAYEDPVAEGGILCSGTVRLDLPERRWTAPIPRP